MRTSCKKAEAIIELLEDFGPVSEDTRESVLRERDLGVLKVLHKLAARAESMDDFIKDAGVVRDTGVVRK